MEKVLHKIFWAPIPFKQYQNKSGRPLPSLTRPNQKLLYQLLTFLNLYQHAKNQYATDSQF